MIKKTILNISDNQNASLYISPKTNKGTIFYLHGGGLIYGTRDDLPQEYIDLFLDNGYNFFALDYLLAPESNYSDILNSTLNGYNWFIDNLNKFTTNKKVIVFGRSAGAYLCYQIMASEKVVKEPDAFLDFYGFFNLLDSKLTNPDPFYEKYPDVDIKQLIESHDVYSGDINKRFPIYLQVRKEGSWANLLAISPKEQVEVDFNKLPPTFITHATSDPDVAFSIALQEKMKNKNATLKTINTDQHDFDRTVNDQNIDLYKKAVNWLKSNIQ